MLAGSTVIALHGGGAASSVAQLGLRVADVDAACADIVAAGGAVRSGPEDRPDEGIRLADVFDTEGNAFMVSARTLSQLGDTTSVVQLTQTTRRP